MKILVLFYSCFGHVYKMAEAIAEGAREVDGAEDMLKRVPETLPEEILQKMGAVEAQKQFQHIPIASRDDLKDADAIIIGTPTRFGNMAAQMRAFWDATGSLWQSGGLIGKVGSVFTSTASQHGGQETTIVSVWLTMAHHGMVIIGLPYAYQGLLTMDEITGGSPYGVSTIAGATGERTPTANELNGARFQGRHVAEITAKMTRQK